jgi:hypothetical protein
MNFKILKPKPVQTDWFWFSLVFIVQKPVKLKSKSRCPVPTNYKQISVSIVQENRYAQCPQITSKSRCPVCKSRCPVSTNYKQISISVVQENRSAHKLQANYNIIKKNKNPQDAEMNLNLNHKKTIFFFYLSM